MIGYTIDEVFDTLEVFPYSREMIQFAYTQEERKYHNLDHLSSMFRHVPRDFMGVETLLEAVLFHDIVYDIKAPKGLNETLSAMEYTIHSLHRYSGHPMPFVNDAEFMFTQEKCVIEAINATSRHEECQSGLSLASRLVLDLDLCSFADEEEFSTSSQKVWEEYEPYIDRATFMLGRKKFLQTLFQRPFIYYVKTEWEQSARLNIQREIEKIDGELSHE